MSNPYAAGAAAGHQQYQQFQQQPQAYQKQLPPPQQMYQQQNRSNPSVQANMGPGYRNPPPRNGVPGHMNQPAGPQYANQQYSQQMSRPNGPAGPAGAAQQYQRPPPQQRPQQYQQGPPPQQRPQQYQQGPPQGSRRYENGYPQQQPPQNYAISQGRQPVPQQPVPQPVPQKVLQPVPQPVPQPLQQQYSGPRQPSPQTQMAPGRNLRGSPERPQPQYGQPQRAPQGVPQGVPQNVRPVQSNSNPGYPTSPESKPFNGYPMQRQAPYQQQQHSQTSLENDFEALSVSAPPQRHEMRPQSPQIFKPANGIDRSLVAPPITPSSMTNNSGRGSPAQMARSRVQDEPGQDRQVPQKYQLSYPISDSPIERSDDVDYISGANGGRPLNSAAPAVASKQPAVSDKRPPPRRKYTDDSTKQKEDPSKPSGPLTVEQFESARRDAQYQPNDPRVMLEWAKKLLEASYTLAAEYTDPENPGHAEDARAERKNREAWVSRSYKTAKKLVSQQYAPAMFFLGSQYSSGGLGLETDYDKAYQLYHKGATLGDAACAYRVAVCDEIGAGTKRDPQAALRWYKKAAQLGDVSAMYKLGMISLNGLLGQPKSIAESITWLERAEARATSECPHAVHELGLLYERADSMESIQVIRQDERKAFEYFFKAAKLGYPPSQFRLGCAYEYGSLGCKIDPKRSIAWYSRAAEKGEPESELALSGWYLTGSEGILQQSDTEAYLWARKAAEKGLAKAEYALGYFSEVGIGINADEEEARRWYYKAANQKHPKAMARLQEMRERKF